MRVSKIRIEKRPKPFVLDEQGIKDAYLRGDKPARIAANFTIKAQSSAVHEFIRENRDAWDEERERVGLVDCGTKVVIEKRVTAGTWGGAAWIKVSLPRISMFLAARSGAAPQ